MALIHTADRGSVYLVDLDPTRGSESRKMRPYVVISPDELNDRLPAVIIAPMTTGAQAYPWRVPCRFRDRAGVVAIDQIRTVDRERLVKRAGRLSEVTVSHVLARLAELFAP